MSVAAWRIVHSHYLAGALTGEGSSRYPGRWNPHGVPVVYAAGSLSLAAMEMLVHVDVSDILEDYRSISVHFDERLCRRLAMDDLPENWMEDPPPRSTRALGGLWATQRQSAVLAVPSVVIPLETVYLLNPNHPDFASIEVGPAREFRFDPRLLAKRA